MCLFPPTLFIELLEVLTSSQSFQSIMVKIWPQIYRTVLESWNRTKYSFRWDCYDVQVVEFIYKYPQSLLP